MRIDVRRSLFVLALLAACAPAWAQTRLSVAYPGPFNISYLPLDIATRIGADKAEGVELVPRPTGGGGAALQQLQNRNVDFAVAGLPAAMSSKANGNDVTTIMAIDDLAVFVLTVRADLADKVKRPRDLAGRVVGVTSSSLTVKTISQQLAELLLKSDGLPPEQVRIVPAGQSWEELSAIMRSKSADAILGFEPFASRLRDAGLAFFLFNLGDPADAARVPGAGLLQASLHVRGEMLRAAPERAEKMVAVLRRTLHWMAGQTPENIVAALDDADTTTREGLLALLRRYPRLYSPDGRFSDHQMAETARFYAATDGARRPVPIESIVDARWAGRKP
ncbi:MAG: ABC transporter substrate-binding protein [Pseudomonadota bacterium]